MPFLVFLFLILMTVVGYFAQMNPDRVMFFVARDTAYSISLTTLILGSVAVGGFFVMITSGVRQTKALYLNWTYRKRQKKEAQVDAAYKIGMNAFLAKRHKEAITSFRKALDLFPNHIPTLLRLGEIYRIEKKFEEAIRLHRVAQVADPQNVEVSLQLAHDLDAAGQEHEVLAWLKEIIHQDEENLTALIHLRDIYIRQSSWESACEVQEKIMKCPLSDEARHDEQRLFTGIHYEEGRRLLERKQTDAARRAFKRAVKMDKSFIPAYVGLGEVYLQEGHVESAMTLFEKGYTMTQSIIVLHRLEELCMELGQPDRILKAYQQSIHKNPESLTLRFYLGKLYYRLEMVDQAFDLLSELQEQAPHLFDLQEILGHLHWRRGEFLRAAEKFRACLETKAAVVYICSRCSHQMALWSGRCDSCGRWNTYAPPSPDRGTGKSFTALNEASSLSPAKHPAEAVTGGGF